MSFRKLTVLALLLSLLLTACGGIEKASAPAEDSESEENYEWTADFYTFDMDIAPESAVSDGEYVYFTTKYSGESFWNAETEKREYIWENPIEHYRWKIGDEPEKLPITSKMLQHEFLDRIVVPDGSGSYYIVTTTSVSKYDSSGSELFFETVELHNDNLTLNTAVDAEGHLFIRGGHGLVYLFNTDCTLNSIYNSEVNGLTNTPDGTVYLMVISNGNEVLKLDFQNKTETLYKNCGIANTFEAYLDKGFLNYYEDSMYLFSTETEKLEELFIWSNIGIDPGEVQSYCVLSDGSIVAFISDDTIGTGGMVVDTINTIAHISLKEAAEKKVITLGTFSSNTTLRLAAADFNRYHPDYLIEIKEYYNSYTDNTVGHTALQDAITQFNLDIVSGNGPDILSLSYSDLENYASQDLFEDLTPYVESSTLNIPENIKDAYTFDGILTALTPFVKLRLFVAKSDDFEDITGWTLEEMMEYVNSHPDETVFDVGSRQMLKYCLTFNQSRFIDWDNSSCSFENEEFYELLEFCSQFNGGDDDITSNPVVNTSYHSALIYEMSLSSPSDYVLIRQILNTGDLSFIGFPTDSGSGIIVEENKGSYAISSQSENKDIAWSFIESLMTMVPTYDYINVRSGYPTDISVREEYFTNVMEEPYIQKFSHDDPERRDVGIDGLNGTGPYYYYIPFEEELQPIIDLLEVAESPKSDSTILDIILENAADYFSGEKSVEEVAKQIQSRVMLYLGEIK